MSIPYNDTTNGTGHVQLYENECGFNRGDVSGSTSKLKDFNAKFRIALDTYFALAIQASGTWELDDNNHGDYAVIYATITSGQRDYSFLTDSQGNQILDIYKVLILPTATDTTYREIDPIDENNPRNVSTIDENAGTGTPNTYAKRANAIHFDVLPNYTVARGIKVLINRSSSYPDYDETTWTAGYPYHQEYFHLKPAKDQIRVYGTESAYNRISNEVLKLEGDVLTGRVGLIAKAYGNRKKDEIDSISGEVINSI